MKNWKMEDVENEGSFNKPNGKGFCHAMLCISADDAVMQCPPVRLSHLCILSKQVIISSHFCRATRPLLLLTSE